MTMRRGRPDPLAELDEARRALDAAAVATAAAYETWQDARTDAAERRGLAAWEKAREVQNRAAQRLHAANRALDRPALDDAECVGSGQLVTWPVTAVYGSAYIDCPHCGRRVELIHTPFVMARHASANPTPTDDRPIAAALTLGL